jgi:hypothetical protein
MRRWGGVKVFVAAAREAASWRRFRRSCRLDAIGSLAHCTANVDADYSFLN